MEECLRGAKSIRMCGMHVHGAGFSCLHSQKSGDYRVAETARKSAGVRTRVESSRELPGQKLDYLLLEFGRQHLSLC